MVRRHYVLDTDDKRLIDDARHAIADGSLRKLARLLKRSDPYLRHVLAGRAKGLDQATRQRLQHLITIEQVRQILMDDDMRWEKRASLVIDHLLTCDVCLVHAVQASDKHFTQTVADRFRNR